MRIDLWYDPVRLCTDVFLDGVPVPKEDPYGFLYAVRQYPLEGWVKKSSRFQGLESAVEDYSRGEKVKIVFHGSPVFFGCLPESRPGLSVECEEWHPEQQYPDFFRDLSDAMEEILAPLPVLTELTSTDFIESAQKTAQPVALLPEPDSGIEENTCSMDEFLSRRAVNHPAPALREENKEPVPCPDLIAAWQAVGDAEEECWLLELRSREDIQRAKKMPMVCCLLWEGTLEQMEDLTFSLNRGENAIGCILTDSVQRESLRAAAAAAGKDFWVLSPDQIQETKEQLWQEYGCFYKLYRQMKKYLRLDLELNQALQHSQTESGYELRRWEIERAEAIARFRQTMEQGIRKEEVSCV